MTVPPQYILTLKERNPMKQETQQKIDAVATAIASDIVIKDGTASIAADAYVKSLPEGISLETVMALQEHNTNWFPGVTKAFGLKAIDAMKQDPALKTLALTVPLVGEDKLDLSFSKEYPYTDTKTKEQKMAYGGLNASLTVQASLHNRGAMGAVKRELKEAALAAFGKD